MSLIFLIIDISAFGFLRDWSGYSSNKVPTLKRFSDSTNLFKSLVLTSSKYHFLISSSMQNFSLFEAGGRTNLCSAAGGESLSLGR